MSHWPNATLTPIDDCYIYWKFVEVDKRDVIFKFKAEVFHAHKLVVAA